MEDKERLDENIRFAEELGAEIIMTHGENVPLQISEYAQLSNVTEIVIGQSSMKRNYFSVENIDRKADRYCP